MQVTRRQILKAIRTEKLKPGAFIHEKKKVGSDGYITYEADKTCKVCAVGGVLRAVGVGPDAIENTAYSVCHSNAIGSDGDEFRLLEEKDYMSALSVKFERLAEEEGTGKRTREKLCNFVKKNFPKRIKLDI